MKKLTMLCLVMVFSTAICVHSGNAGEKVTLANGDWAPYFGENLKHNGVVSRIVKEAFALEGVDVDYAFRPWKRGFEEAKQGKLDGAVGWVKNDDRLKDFFFSAPIAKNTNVFFVKKGTDFSWNSVSDLGKYKIGGIVGFFYGKEFEDAEKSGAIMIDRVPDDETNFKKLIAGRMDLIIADLEVGYDLINTKMGEAAGQLTHNAKAITEEDLFLLMNRQNTSNEQLIETFNKGLENLQTSGKSDQYYEESRRGEYRVK
ncbi:polar amino acid transport system substrate-binding protein [Desulfopila aestuarii DSM 18488]|uniref:Polar amino acid transport system substrate-binding protein n=2 Tax=Desulfopila aestuarii TaxID=231440 RepID=A0A1M7YG05_9BACT|nr:polar amino acid transport system substrate-binding protein [Desulfopila aestuarii DSM 18488]